MNENLDNSQTTENTAETVDSAKNATANPNETEQLAQKLKEAEQKYIYLYADFENFKKRAFKERQDIVKFGWEPVASELIPVLDNFERALQYAKPETDPNLLSGLQMVATQFKSALEKQGVQTIQSMDRPFTPELHESMGEVPSDQPKGVIVQEHLKGYTLHGRLLRPSKVMISSGTRQN